MQVQVAPLVLLEVALLARLGMEPMAVWLLDHKVAVAEEVLEEVALE